MRILLVNDDGIESESLILLARALKDRHTVTVVAPDSERSAAGHCYTFHLPLSLKRVTAPVWEGITAYKTNGSPCDCTMLGLGAADFSVGALRTQSGYLYAPAGRQEWNVLYLIAGLIVPLLIGGAVRRLGARINRMRKRR